MGHYAGEIILGVLPGHDEQLLLAGLHVKQAAVEGGGLVQEEGEAHERVPAAPGQPPHPADQSDLPGSYLLWNHQGRTFQD